MTTKIKPHFDAPDETFVLILEHPDGAVYHAQVGGMLCLQEEITGYIFQDRSLNWQFSTVYKQLTELSCEYGCCGTQISEEGFAAISAIWPEPPEYVRWWIKPDEERWEESKEAWIPVRTYATGWERDIIQYVEDADTVAWLCNGVNGVIVLENCD